MKFWQHINFAIWPKICPHIGSLGMNWGQSLFMGQIVKNFLVLGFYGLSKLKNTYVKTIYTQGKAHQGFRLA